MAITFDFTGTAPSGTSISFLQNGLSLTVSSALYYGGPTGTQQVYEYSTPTMSMNGQGIGALNPYNDLEAGFDADGKYEIATFAFSQAVRITSVTFVPLGTRYNTTGANTQFQLFEDGLVLDPATRQYVDPSDNTNDISLFGTFIGIAAYNRFDQFRIASITVEEINGVDTIPDTYAIDAGTEPVVLDVLANDVGAQSITSVNTTGLLGTVSISADGLTLTYDEGTAFDNLAPGQTATETFTYSVLGIDGSTATETVTITITGASSQILGTALADLLNGTDGRNLMYGYAGRDTMNGGAGNDGMYGGIDNDVVHGNTGNDYVDGEDGNDLVYGDEGNDTVMGGGGFDTIYGGSQDDYLDSGEGGDAAYGGNGNDIIYGRGGNDRLSGQIGNDTVYGGVGADVLYGNENDDRLFGEADADQLYGGTGNDSLVGDTGNDRLYGEDGTDTLEGGADSDQLYGGNGNDLLDGGDLNDALYGDADNDTLLGGAGTDRLYGGTGDDSLVGGTGNDQLFGDDGNDTLVGGDDADLLNGGAGADVMIGGVLNNSYYVDNLGDVIQEGASGGTDTVYAAIDWVLGDNLENLILNGAGNQNGTGNAAINQITGNAFANLLSGMAGNDRLTGGDGADTLEGGTGRDNLTGGNGPDAFRFNEFGTANADTIVDYSTEEDVIELGSSVFGQAIGSLSATAFVIGTAATSADHRIVYDQIHGDIYFDADGNGTGARQLIASVADNTVLNELDFLFV